MKVLGAAKPLSGNLSISDTVSQRQPIQCAWSETQCVRDTFEHDEGVGMKREGGKGAGKKGGRGVNDDDMRH